jgi:hypothetical protein
MSYTWSCTKCQLHIILNMGDTSSCLGMSIVSLFHTHHEFGMGISRWAKNWRKFKIYVTIEDWRKVVHLQMFDIIIVKHLEGIPRTFSGTESLQTVHNAILWAKTCLWNCRTNASRGLILNIREGIMLWRTSYGYGLLRWAHVWVIIEICNGLYTRLYLHSRG